MISYKIDHQFQHVATDVQISNVGLLADKRTKVAIAKLHDHSHPFLQLLSSDDVGVNWQDQSAN